MAVTRDQRPAYPSTVRSPACPPDQPPHPESGAWDGVRTGWSQVFGSFEQLGVSVETHDFQADAELDWGRSFHPDSVEICLNLDGHASVEGHQQRADFAPQAGGFYAVTAEPLRARRGAGQRHRFVTIELGRSFLVRHLGSIEAATVPLVRNHLAGAQRLGAIAPVRPLTLAHQSVATALASPPVPVSAFPLWYESKVMEAAAHFLFTPEPELFCTRQKRLARERVERASTLLRTHLADPPTLEALAREVGMSACYLSRTFSQETGLSILQYLRRVRMERAAELLRAGTHNVTEAAFEVGYSSLGHFSKSFCEVIGCCPALYPQAASSCARKPRGSTARRPGG